MRGIGHRAGDQALLALIALCLPAFLVSAWVETTVAKWMVPADRKPRCARWSVEANLASYLMIEGVLVTLYVAIALWRRWGWIS
jgi:hypothetical protein